MDGFQEAAVAGLNETRARGFAETVAPTGVDCTLGSVVGPAKLGRGDGWIEATSCSGSARDSPTFKAVCGETSVDDSTEVATVELGLLSGRF